MKKHIKQNWSLFAVITIYLISIAVINPFSEYAVNDDWDFITHVRNFRQGDFTKNSLIDSSFILQGFMGVAWSFLFGLNYPALKALTVIVSLVSLVILNMIFGILDLEKKQRFLGLMVFIFNPFVYPFSFTFMTEIYFLFLVLLSIYFFLKFFKTKKFRYIFWSLFVSSLSLMVRQLGLLLFPVQLLVLILVDIRDLKRKFPYMLAGSAAFVACALISFLWPQYNSDMEKPLDIVTKSIMEPQIMLNQLKQLHFLVPYIAFSLLVFTLPIFFRISHIGKGLVIAVTTLSFKAFYEVDLFKIGNTFYSEGLLIKNNYISHVNIYDNILFKFILNALLLVSVYSFLVFVVENRKKLRGVQNLVLLLCSLFFLIPIALQKTVYDRYYVNGLVILAIFCQQFILSCIKPTRRLYLGQVVVLFFWSFYVFTLSYDYHKTAQIQWQQAAELREVRAVGNKIYMSDTYSKYRSVFFKPNGPKISRALPMGLSYKCYIQKDYFPNESNVLYSLLSRINSSRKLNKLFKNPSIYGAGTIAGYRPPSRDTRKILFTQDYFLFQEWLVGTKVRIVTYCNDLI